MGYVLQVDQGATMSLDIPPDDREVVADGLTNGQQYCFQLCAVNAMGRSEEPDMLWATPGTPPSPPQFDWAAIPTYEGEGMGIVLVFLKRPQHLGGLPVEKYSIEVFEFDAATAATKNLSESGLCFLDTSSSFSEADGITDTRPGCGKKVGSFSGDDSPVVCRNLQDNSTYVMVATASNTFGQSKCSRVSAPVKVFVRHFDGEKWSSLVDDEGQPNTVVSFEMMAAPGGDLDASSGSMHPLEESFDLLDSARMVQGQRSRALLRHASKKLTGLSSKRAQLKRQDSVKMGVGKARFRAAVRRVIIQRGVARVKEKLTKLKYPSYLLGA
jgi:hypothetical protein